MTSYLLALAVLVLIAENYYFRYQLYKTMGSVAQVGVRDWINYQTAVLHLMHKAGIRFRDLYTTQTAFTESADHALDSFESEAKTIETKAVAVEAEVKHSL